MHIPPSPHITVTSLLGTRFFVGAALATISMALVLGGILVQLDGFEEFYEYTRGHESWNLDEWAMAGLATLISMSLIGVVVIAVLTKRLLQKEAERQATTLRLQQSQSLVALGTMVAGTAHSINNHLMPVIALTDLVRSELPEGDTHARDLEKVLIAARSAAEIVTRMKTFAKTNHSVKGICNVGPTTTLAIDLARNVAPSSAKFSVSVQSVSAQVAMSSTAWEIVILNLINNAVDALEDEPGTIEIILTAHAGPDVTDLRTNLPTREWVQLQVIDTGKGIDPENMKHIFEPFFTTKEVGKGTGLGLPESYGIVDNAGGRIEVESVLGQGTKFVVWLPAINTTEPSNT